MSTLTKEPNINLSTPPSSLTQLPSEVLLHILTYTDIPDLLTLSRTSTHLRSLSRDPLLHTSRLHRASSTLELILPRRSTLASLIAIRIYVTRTTFVARNLGRNLIKIRLNRKLSARPSVEVLVRRGVLPRECFGARGVVVAPGLVAVKRRVERERVKDFLRAWVGEWRVKGGRGVEVGEREIDVGRLVRRFGREREGVGNDVRWGEKAKGRNEPDRAKVLGLRRFWERVGREGMSSS